MSTKKPRTNHRPNGRDKERYRLFAEAYLNIGDKSTYMKAIPSAIAAGYKEGWSRGHAFKLVAKVGVQAEFKRIRDTRLKSSTIASSEEILETLTQQMRTLPNQLVDENGAPIPLNKLTRDQAQAIAGYKETSRAIAAGNDVITETKREYKLIDRQKAAELLARWLGLFEKDNEQQKPDEPVRFVMMPSGDLTLAEWTRQVEELNASRAEAEHPSRRMADRLSTV